MPKGRPFTSDEDEYIRAHYSSMSCRDIAVYLGRSKRSIDHRVRRLGVGKQVLRRWTEAEDEVIRSSVGRTLRDVAAELGRRESEVSTRSRALGIPSWRKRNGYKPDNHGRTVAAYQRKNGRSVRVMEHRSVMESTLGRSLTSDEVVHHINGVKTDNRAENLYLCSSRSQHKRIHYSIEQLLSELLERGIVRFDRARGIYELCESSK